MDEDRAFQRDIERETRRRMRREMRAAARAEHAPLRAAMLGVVIIGVGVAMLLNTLGVVRFRDIWDFIPLIFVLFGSLRMINSAGKMPAVVGGGILIAIGGFWFAHNMGWLYIDTRLIGPIVVIGLGVLFLVRAIDRQQRFFTVGSGCPLPDGTADPNAGPLRDSTAAFAASADFAGAVGSVLHEWILFGGLKRRIVSQQFRGGDMFAMFGGIEADLRGAGMAGNQIVIDATAIFGGIDLKVPSTWHVVVRGQGIFGGYEDKTLPATVATPQPQILIVSGVAMFGGVVVQN